MNNKLVISSQSLSRVRAICLGKIRFPSKEIAWYVFDFVQSHHFHSKFNDAYLLSAYRCPYCGSYHLGKKLNKKPNHSS